MNVIKNVIVLDPSWSYETFQSFYLDRSHKRMRPNVTIVKPPSMEVYFQTNAHGFKGMDVDPAKRLVAVWGDSVVFGIGLGWVEGLGTYFPNYQFLNGGLEGDPLENICDRALEANKNLDIRNNLIFPGWHTIRNPKKVHSLLNEITDKLRGTILCTVPTSLSEKMVNIDMSPYFKAFDPTQATETYYMFWGGLKYSIDNARDLFRRLQEQNSIVREIAKKKALPLADLYKYFYTEDLTKFREDFFDAGHPRPRAYSKLQQFFKETLKDVLV